MAMTQAGTVSFLFTDVEDSTRSWESNPAATATALEAHERILTAAIEAHDGRVFATFGDAFCASFATPAAAVEAARSAQASLQAPTGPGLKVRMAIHVGESQARNGDYYGPTLNLCARILAAGHGGQILISGAVADDLRSGEEDTIFDLLDLGTHRLRDIAKPEHLYQVNTPGLQAEFLPLRSLENLATNLPSSLTSFVGRKQEREEIQRALGLSRLVTLTGPGGVGKTRLALRVGEDALERRQGVWLVDFTALETGQPIFPRIALALGVREREELSTENLIVDRFRHADDLLIFDNCEHVVGDVAGAALRLLTACPGLRILATSRARLAARGELLYQVSPLPVPGSGESAAEVTNRDAVRLFCERARLAEPRFRINAGNAALVADITRRLDGIPLAIELVASELRFQSVATVAQRLGDTLPDAADPSPDTPQRHRTMRAVMDWSYELLTDDERSLLHALSVFRGGFDPEAVSAICGPALDDVEATLIALVDKSLVSRAGEQDRLALLEMVRQYAAEQADPTTAIRQRHLDFFLAMAQEGIHARTRSEWRHWLEQMDRELDNIRAALSFAPRSSDPADALRVVVALWPYLRLRGLLGEARHWLRHALKDDPGGDPELLMAAHYAAGDLDVLSGDFLPARLHLATALALAITDGDQRMEAAVMARQASIVHKEGDTAGALSHLTNAARLAEQAGAAGELSLILSSLALISQDRGEPERAEEHATRAVAVSHDGPDGFVEADALLSAAEVMMNLGRLDQSRMYLEQALVLAEEERMDEVAAWARGYLGRLYLVSDPARAEALLEAGVSAFRRFGSPVGEIWSLRHLGLAAANRDPVVGAGHLAVAVDLAFEHALPELPLVLAALARVAMLQGDLDRAATAAGAAEGIAARLELVLPGLEGDSISLVLEEMSTEASQRLVASGRLMTPEEAIQALRLGV